MRRIKAIDTLRTSKLTLSPENKSLRKTTLFTTGLSFVAKAIAFLQSMLVAYYFGAKLQVDLFYFSYNIILWGFIFVQSLSSSAIIPFSMQIRENEGRVAAERFLNPFILFILFFSAIVAVLMLWKPIPLFSLISKFDNTEITANLSTIRIIFSTFFFFGINALLAEILISFRYFTIPVIVNIINNSIPILLLLYFGDRFSINIVATGFLIAYFINFLILLFLVKYKLRWHFFIFDFYKLKSQINKLTYTFLGTSIIAVSSFIPFYLISSFEGGTITVTHYSWKIIEAVLSIISTQFLIIVGVRLNELYYQGDIKHFEIYFLKSAKNLFIIFSLITLILYLIRLPILAGLFYRGEMPWKSIEKMCMIFKVLIFILPYSAFIYSCHKIFYSTQKLKELFYTQLILGLLIILSVFLCIRYFGYIGFGYGLLIAYTLSAFIMLLFLKKIMDINYNTFLPYLLGFIPIATFAIFF